MSSDVQVAVAVEQTKEPARKLGFSGCDQTKVAIVTCELPTNILVQAQGKRRVLVDSMAKLDKVRIMVIVEDKGP